MLREGRPGDGAIRAHSSARVRFREPVSVTRSEAYAPTFTSSVPRGPVLVGGLRGSCEGVSDPGSMVKRPVSHGGGACPEGEPPTDERGREPVLAVPRVLLESSPTSSVVNDCHPSSSAAASSVPEAGERDREVVLPDQAANQAAKSKLPEQVTTEPRVLSPVSNLGPEATGRAVGQLILSSAPPLSVVDSRPPLSPKVTVSGFEAGDGDREIVLPGKAAKSSGADRICAGEGAQGERQPPAGGATYAGYVAWLSRGATPDPRATNPEAVEASASRGRQVSVEEPAREPAERAPARPPPGIFKPARVTSGRDVKHSVLDETAGSCAGTSDDESMHSALGSSDGPPLDVADDFMPPLRVEAKTALDGGGGSGAHLVAPSRLGEGASSSLFGSLTPAEAEAAAALAEVAGSTASTRVFPATTAGGGAMHHGAAAGRDPAAAIQVQRVRAGDVDAQPASLRKRILGRATLAKTEASLREDKSLDELETYALGRMAEHQDDMFLAERDAETSVMLAGKAAARMEEERELHRVIEADIRLGMEAEIRQMVARETLKQ